MWYTDGKSSSGKVSLLDDLPIKVCPIFEAHLLKLRLIKANEQQLFCQLKQNISARSSLNSYADVNRILPNFLHLTNYLSLKM